MRRRFLAIVSVALLAGAAGAQSTNASLTGRVSDPSRARIVGSKVVAICAGTNVRYEAATDAAGEYSLASLPPGVYRIEVEKSGFKKLIKPDVVLHVQDALDLDFAMAVGSVSESITVKGGAPLVKAESATASTVVDRTFVEDLPLNGRSFQTLIMLTPGVVVTQTAFDDQGQFSVNGQRADANYFTVDGVSANFGVTGYFPLLQSGGGALPALTVSGGTNSLVSVDAMQEFRVQTSSFAPEFGRTPGGQISIATRSGSNSFHGTLFEYFRNDVLDANDWFNGYTNNPPLPKARDRQNDFGGVIGGPIVQDKTFFFFSYEGLRLRQPSTRESIVPDGASRSLQTAAGIAMQPYLEAYPMPNGADLGNGLAHFNASYSDASSLNAYSIRVDQIVNSKLTLFGRYDYSPSNLSQRGAGFYNALSGNEHLSSSIHTFTVGVNQIVSPHISNEVRTNYSNQRVAASYSMDNFGGAVPFSNLPLFPGGRTVSNSNLEFYMVGASSYELGKVGTDEQRQLNLIDNLSIVAGSHQMKFGVDYRWLSPISSPNVYAQFAEFSGVTSCSPQPCASTSVETPGDALSGVSDATFVHSLRNDTLLSHNLSAYAQDTWKITPRLTLTYGLRWEFNPPIKGKNLTNQPFTITGLNDPATIALAPQGTPLYQTTYTNFAPRVGVAYQIDIAANWTSVLRGGFGLFYDLGNGPTGGSSSYFPFHADAGYFLQPFPLSRQNATPPALSNTPPVGTMLAADPNLVLPRTYEWNAAFEQSLGSTQSLSLSYIGAAGRDLLRNTNLISPNANFGFIGITTNSATSDYQAFQIKFERQLSQGLQALASYTWSHSIDIASTDAAFNYLSTPISVANPDIDRGDSDFDVRHTFTAGVTYNLPSPRWNSVAHASFSGWSVDGFIFARSAPPVNVVGGLVFANGIALYPRPDVTPGIPLYVYGFAYPGGKIINNTPGAVAGGCPNGSPSVGPFCPPALTSQGTFRQGDFGRNVLRGFGGSQADIAFQREFHFTERLRLRFRGEFFNIFNHPSFGSPDNNITDALFGYSTATLNTSLGSGGANGGLNPLYQIGGPRSIQLSLKLQF